MQTSLLNVAVLGPNSHAAAEGWKLQLRSVGLGAPETEAVMRHLAEALRGISFGEGEVEVRARMGEKERGGRTEPDCRSGVVWIPWGYKRECRSK